MWIVLPDSHTASMTTTQEAPTRHGNYVDAGGVATYYEVTGDGDPVILLHGGMCTAETWDAQVPALAERHTVYVPERYGHGRTADIEGSMTYEAQALHTIAFIDALGIESPHLVGWSDGALAGLLIALRRPTLVGKVVYIDQFVTLDAAPAFYNEMMAGLTAEQLPPFLTELYRAVSPDGPDHLSVIVDKLRAMWTGETGVEVSDLSHVTAPTLVLAGDTGGMPLAHIAAVQAALPDCQVAVVPGTSHALALEKPHVVNQLILDFLADEQVAKVF